MPEDQSLAEQAARNDEPNAVPPEAAKEPKFAALTRERWLIPATIFVLAALLFFIISTMWVQVQNKFWLNTDDAYVRADVAPLSTRERGIVSKTFVKDFQHVSVGQTLIELRNEDYKDRVNEAGQSRSTVQIKLDDMKNRKDKLDADIQDAQANLDNSRAALRQFDSTIAISKSGIDEARGNLEAAQAAVKQSESVMFSASADKVKTELAKKREEALLSEESSTKEKVEQVQDEYARSAAALEGQKAALQKARAEAAVKKAQLRKAQDQVSSVLVDKDKAATLVKSKQAEVVVRQMDRKLLDGEERQLKADFDSKSSAFDTAKVDLGYTTIKAPVDGSIGELRVKLGQYVNAGTQVATLVSSTPWVVANFRETQAAKIKVGDWATIKIDALSNQAWDARVESISPASGAQFSLLPPDNASGNFTKITQRIPVKLVFENKDGKNQDLTGLRPGMSALVSITAH